MKEVDYRGHRLLENELLEAKALWDSIVQATGDLREAIEKGDIKTAHRLSLTIDIKSVKAFKAINRAHKRYNKIFSVNGNERD